MFDVFLIIFQNLFVHQTLINIGLYILPSLILGLKKYENVPNYVTQVNNIRKMLDLKLCIA